MRNEESPKSSLSDKVEKIPEKQIIVLLMQIDMKAGGVGFKVVKSTFVNDIIALKALEVAAELIVDALKGGAPAIAIHRSTTVGEHPTVEIVYKKSNDGDIVYIPSSSFDFDAMVLACIDNQIELIKYTLAVATAKAAESMIVQPGRA